MQKEVLKARMQSLISSYIADRDQAIADFNLVILKEEYKPEPQYNITLILKPIMDRIIQANSGIKETQEMWNRMNMLEDVQNSEIKNEQNEEKQ